MKFLVLIGKASPFILGTAVPIFLVLLWLNLSFFRPVDPGSSDLRYVEIPSGASSKDIASLLSQSSLVSSSFAARFILDRKLSKENLAVEDLIPPGEYEISPSLPPKKVIEALTKSNRISRTFEVLPGMEYFDIAKEINKSGLFGKEETLKAMTKREILIRLKVEASIPEGYILPDSYTFSKPLTPQEMVEKLIHLSAKNLLNKFIYFNERTNDLYLDKHKILTLASIIEKESPEPAFRKKISAVYHNRYLLGLPLESTAALQYGLKTNRPPSQDEKNAPGPYNTFIINNFPASPICTPSFESIEAALHPDESLALYFFRNKNGEFEFSEKLSDHKLKIETRGQSL
ncbi:MAG TPA: endolytic transglycosylase MltG [Oligoflexia bacterium]|nr:endolytic transglycosylase MltG [Oligoflexia bacterium]HMP48966.1 endolytic transglycosylase MltG [Oligoflexia bacterium]